MREFFIKGKKVKPGLTITTSRRTYVVTNEYKLHYVESGNHAEVHVTQQEMRSIRQYFIARTLIDVADAFVNACRRLGRKE